MSWSWPRNNPRLLAKYVTVDTGYCLSGLTASLHEAKSQDRLDWVRRTAAAVYEALADEDIKYDFEPFKPDEPGAQIIRQPQEILGKTGTCLDLAILFSGACLHMGLLPILLVFNDANGVGHALVAVSRTEDSQTFDQRRDPLAGALARQDPAGRLFNDGDALRAALDPDGAAAYWAIECTGFASGDAVPLPQGIARTAGRLSFGDALTTGWERVGTGSLRFALDVAFEQNIATFALATLDNTILAHPIWVRQRWRDWIQRQNPASPVFPAVPTDERVPSPLLEDWDDFSQDQPWHECVRERAMGVLRELRACAFLRRPEIVAQFERAVGQVHWDANYEKIRANLARPARDVHEETQRSLGLLNAKKVRDAAVQRQIDQLHACRKEARDLRQLVETPRFGRCFLVAGSHGSGKSYFLDALARRTASLHVRNMDSIFLRIRLAGHGAHIESTILHELEDCFGMTLPPLELVDQRLCEAEVRLVVVLDDLQDQILLPAESVPALTQFIANHTAQHSLYWLLTLNDTAYDKVARLSEFWVQHAWLDDAEAGADVHSGWLLLDAINGDQVGPRILKEYQPEGSDLGLDVHQVQEFAAQYVCSPLIALIMLELSAADPDLLLQGLNFIALIAAFWKRRLNEVDVSPLDTAQVSQAVTCIAERVARDGGFRVSRSELLQDLGEVRRPSEETLECLQRLSLLTQHMRSSETPYAPLEDDNWVALLFELFWCHHLAKRIEVDLARRKLPAKRLAEEALGYLGALEAPSVREIAAEHLLLLADARGVNAGLWNALQTDPHDEHLRAAVYLAGSKAAPDRQKELSRALREGNAAPTSPRELFAVMHFLAQTGAEDFKGCLKILRRRRFAADTPFKFIVDAKLGDYFWFLFKRRDADVADLQTMVRCLHLLQFCLIENVTSRLAMRSWDKLWGLADEDRDTVLAAVEDYLRADGADVETEYAKIKRVLPQGGVPFYFREYILRSLFSTLLESDRLDLYDILTQRNWFRLDGRGFGVRSGRPTPKRKANAKTTPALNYRIIREMRRHWSLSVGAWFRWPATNKERELYRNLVTRLIASKQKDEWEISYFMIRHTVPITPGSNVAYVDPAFRPILDNHASKIAALQQKYPVRFSGKD